MGGLAGRLELGRLATGIGYRVLYAPDVRALQIVDGGIAGTGPVLKALAASVAAELASGEADVAELPALALGSEQAAAFEALGGLFGRQPLIAPWTHRKLVLPATFDEFMASRSQKTRYGTRRDAKRFEAQLGHRIATARLDRADDLETLVRDLDAVARTTYQRRLGAGFADTPEQRALARIGLQHGWVRAYVLYVDSAPIAYWLCSVYGRTMLLRTGGYEERHVHHAVGIYLLMSVIEDACSDPAIDVLDFGPGDASYKRQFSSESVKERNLVLFAPTFRARRINAVRTAILGSARLARIAADSAGVTERMRARARARGSGQ